MSLPIILRPLAKLPMCNFKFLQLCKLHLTLIDGFSTRKPLLCGSLLIVRVCTQPNSARFQGPSLWNLLPRRVPSIWYHPFRRLSGKYWVMAICELLKSVLQTNRKNNSLEYINCIFFSKWLVRIAFAGLDNQQRRIEMYRQMNGHHIQHL